MVRFYIKMQSYSYDIDTPIVLPDMWSQDPEEEKLSYDKSELVMQFALENIGLYKVPGQQRAVNLLNRPLLN